MGYTQGSVYSLGEILRENAFLFGANFYAHQPTIVLQNNESTMEQAVYCGMELCMWEVWAKLTQIQAEINHQAEKNDKFV